MRKVIIENYYHGRFENDNLEKHLQKMSLWLPPTHFFIKQLT